MIVIEICNICINIILKNNSGQIAETKCTTSEYGKSIVRVW